MNARLIAFLIVVLVPAFAAAQDSAGPDLPVGVSVEAESAERLAFLLSAYHELPARAEFEAVPDAQKILSTWATDRTAPLRQKRSLEALGYFADATTLAIYTSVLNDPQTRVGARHQTILLVGTHFGVAGLDLLGRYLEADDVQLRLSAVDAIARTNTDRGFALLEERAETEPNKTVLERIEKLGRRLR